MVWAPTGGSWPCLGDEGDSHGTWCLNVAVGHQPLSWLQPEIEINSVIHLHRGMPNGHRVSLGGGFVLPLAEWITVRLGLQRGILGGNIDETTIARLSVDWYF